MKAITKKKMEAHENLTFYGGVVFAVFHAIFLDVPVVSHSVTEWISYGFERLITTVIFGLIGGFVAKAGGMLFESYFPPVKRKVISIFQRNKAKRKANSPKKVKP